MLPDSVLEEGLRGPEETFIWDKGYTECDDPERLQTLG